MEVESLADLRLLLGSLAAVRGSGLRSLELRFLAGEDAEGMPPSMGASYPECCYRLPKVCITWSELPPMTGSYALVSLGTPH